MFSLISYACRNPRFIFPCLFFDWWLNIVPGPVIRLSIKWIQKFIKETITINTSYRESNKCSRIVNDFFLLYQSTDICAKKKKTQNCSCMNCSNKKDFCLPVCKVGIWLSLSTAVETLENASCMSELYPERGSESLRPWILEVSNTQNVLSLSRGVGAS